MSNDLTNAGARDAKLSAGRKLVFALLLLVLVIGLIEAGSFLLFRVVDGSVFSYGRMDRERALVSEGLRADSLDLSGQVEGRQSETLALALHPFIGYVYDRAIDNDQFRRHHRHGINRYGFIDSNDTIQKRGDDRLVVGITGGSVAFWLSALGERELVRELKRSPALRQKEIVIVRLALGGYKQPQQLMAITYALSLGGEFDLLINLDGYNEAGLAVNENYAKGVFPFFPRSWGNMAQGKPDLEYQRRVGRVVYLKEERKRLARSQSGIPAAQSVTLQLIWRIRDRGLRASIAAATQALREYRSGELPFAASGPGVDDFDDRSIHRQLAEMWSRCSLELNSLCEAHGIRYFHFLQPNQYAGHKPMGAEERKTAIAASSPLTDAVRAGYELFLELGPELRAAGVNYHDLRTIFEQIEEPLYIDTCCHLNQRGNEILARRIAGEILKAYAPDLSGLVEIAFEREQLLIEIPDRPARVELFGRTRDDRSHQIGPASLGTSYLSSDPRIIEVDFSGKLRARRRGSAVILAENRGLRAELRVEARWDSILSFDSGRPGKGALTPVLRAELKGRGPQQSLSIRLGGALGGASGWLLVGYQPLTIEGLKAKLQESELVVMPFDAGGQGGAAGRGTVRFELPIPAVDASEAGRPTYWRAYFTDPEAEGGYSATNSLMVTPES